MPTESECMADAEWLETYCGPDFQAKKTELADKCCYYDDAREEIEAASQPNKASRSACREMIASMEAACGSKREGKRQEFKDNCCGRFEDLKQEASQVPSGGLFPCDGGGDGGGETGPGGGVDQDERNDNRSPYKCGNTGDESTTDKILGGLFDLADSGMCALFHETCQQGAGEKSVYCCRQEAPSEDAAVAALLAAEGGTGGQTQQCGPGGQPPGWVPPWMPGGYTGTQYAQALLLAALLGVSAFYLIGALFGGEDEEQQPAQRPVVVNVGSKQGQLTQAGAASTKRRAERGSTTSTQPFSKNTQTK